MPKFYLKINSSEDGVWLHFQDSKGRSGSINLPNTFNNQERIVDKAITQFCKDYVEYTGNGIGEETLVEGEVK